MEDTNTIADAYRTAGVALHANGLVNQAAVEDAHRQTQRHFVSSHDRHNVDAMGEIKTTLEYLTHECEIGAGRIHDRLDQIADAQ